MQKQLNQTSKFISLVLRHKPEVIGLELDQHGWAGVEELLYKMNAAGVAIDVDTLHIIVDTNDKKRFAFNEDKSMIRASQGHSVHVNLDLKPIDPPAKLYHGTAVKNLESILQSGLTKQQRQHVHLSATTETANAVGSRHGKPVVLLVDVKAMKDAGFVFYLSQNNVWLTDVVPVQFITVT